MTEHSQPYLAHSVTHYLTTCLARWLTVLLVCILMPWARQGRFDVQPGLEARLLGEQLPDSGVGRSGRDGLLRRHGSLLVIGAMVWG